MHLTIVYQTCRLEPMIEWFFHSLHRECGGNYTNLRVVVVDFHRESRGRDEYMLARMPVCLGNFVHTAPKPNVWQGKHRITAVDFFAASNSRNTGICHAPDGWIAFVDDLSVLLPGWLAAVRRAMDGNYIACGAYKKVKDLVVESGVVLSMTEYPGGIDCRWGSGSEQQAVPAHGALMFGCSFAVPVEALMVINGFEEDCNSLGFEDCITGIMLQNNGYAFKYDRRMLTYESEERHHIEKPFRRMDKGVSPNDKSHAILRMVRGGRNLAPNYFGPGGIRELRAKVLLGEPFPVCQIPQHDWFDGQSIREL